MQDDVPAVQDLQRVTTGYVDSEDRMRIAGETAQGDAVVLWLTQRMLARLLPVFFRWLEQPQAGLSAESEPSGRDLPSAAAEKGHADWLQSFAQQAAVAGLVAQPPVQTTQLQCSQLVHSVDVQSVAAERDDDVALRLTFKGPQEPSAAVEGAGAGAFGVTLTPPILRQWVAILYAQYREAGWALDLWPDWVAQSPAAMPAPAPSSLLH
jgi:hypothetical protein